MRTSKTIKALNKTKHIDAETKLYSIILLMAHIIDAIYSDLRYGKEIKCNTMLNFRKFITYLDCLTSVDYLVYDRKNKVISILVNISNNKETLPSCIIPIKC